MTLGEFAAVVGAPPRWVQNARAVLGVRRKYTEDGARRLGLARLINEVCGLPLIPSYLTAGEALAAWPRDREWVHAAPDASVRLTIDLERYLSAFAIRLSWARTHYAERVRGAPRTRSRNSIAAAVRQGLDPTLIDDALRLSSRERLARLDAATEFFRTARVAHR